MSPGILGKKIGMTQMFRPDGQAVPVTLLKAGPCMVVQRKTPTTDVTGVAELPEGTEMVMPGDNVDLKVELITPVAMDKGLRFAIREGGRTVGAGTVTEVVK